MTFRNELTHCKKKKKPGVLRHVVLLTFLHIFLERFSCIYIGGFQKKRFNDFKTFYRDIPNQLREFMYLAPESLGDST